MMRPLLLAAMALQASASEDNAVPVTWRKIANHYCSPRVDLKTYTTAAAAMRACAQDRRCLAISCCICFPSRGAAQGDLARSHCLFLLDLTHTPCLFSLDLPPSSGLFLLDLSHMFLPFSRFG